MRSKHPFVLLLLFGILCLLFGTFGSAAGSDVPYHTAHQVAQQKLQHHLDLYGAWNGHSSPHIGDGQAVQYKDRLVAYNFAVEPSGHILVAVDRAFSPIPLYSERGRFDPTRADQPATLESWIVPELYNRLDALNAHRRNTRSLPSALRSTVSVEATRVQKVWDYFTQGGSSPTVTSTRAVAVDGDDTEVSTVTVGPLMETAWNQGYPYNTMAPAMDGCDNTITGCVATAWAQTMYYHRWPDAATGSHRYSWNGTIVEAEFEGVSYEWDRMPLIFNDSYDEVAYPPEAVSLLMFHAGVAAEMNYGCNDSGSDQYANDVLDTYFNYKAMERHDRSAETDAVEWFERFKSELDAERIVIFSIFGVNGGGHEVVVDGYQEETATGDPSVVLSRTVHINLGWGGNHDAYYDISNDFATPEGDDFLWTASFQVAVTGIEPNRDPRPEVNAATGNQVRALAGDIVYLNGSTALDPDMVQSYEWLQVSKGTDVVVPSDHDTLNASFRAPEVDAATDLVFMLKVTDTNRSVGFDKVTVTVDPKPSPSKGGSSSSSGPCFISTLQSAWR